jgi:hypothetical protein
VIVFVARLYVLWNARPLMEVDSSSCVRESGSFGFERVAVRLPVVDRVRVLGRWTLLDVTTGASFPKRGSGERAWPAVLQSVEGEPTLAHCAACRRAGECNSAVRHSETAHSSSARFTASNDGPFLMIYAYRQ